MDDDRMALLELAGTHADGDFLRELSRHVLRRPMELEAQHRLRSRSSGTQFRAGQSARRVAGEEAGDTYRGDSTGAPES